MESSNDQSTGEMQHKVLLGFFFCVASLVGLSILTSKRDDSVKRSHGYTSLDGCTGWWSQSQHNLGGGRRVARGKVVAQRSGKAGGQTRKRQRKAPARAGQANCSWEPAGEREVEALPVVTILDGQLSWCLLVGLGRQLCANLYKKYITYVNLSTNAYL